MNNIYLKHDHFESVSQVWAIEQIIYKNFELLRFSVLFYYCNEPPIMNERCIDVRWQNCYCFFRLPYFEFGCTIFKVVSLNINDKTQERKLRQFKEWANISQAKLKEGISEKQKGLCVTIYF